MTLLCCRPYSNIRKGQTIGERFDPYCQAIAEAPARLGELRRTWARFTQEFKSGQDFHIGQHGNLLLGPIHAGTIAEPNGTFKIRFAKIDVNRDEPIMPGSWRQLGDDWSLKPVIENDQFKWTVGEPLNQALTNDELADEVAINLIELSKRESEQAAAQQLL